MDLKFRLYIATVGGILAIILILELINGRFHANDLLVYWSATNEWLQGASPYGQPFGEDTGFFKYSPFALLAFVPLALLPFKVAAVVHYVLTAFAFIATTLLVARSIEMVLKDQESSATYLGSYLIALVCMVHLHRELHLGNVNMLLLLALSVALWLDQRKQAMGAGALIGLVLLIKPHFIVLLPLLLLHRKWMVLGSCAAVVLAGMVAPAAFTGWDTHWALNAEWLRTMAAHNDSMIYTTGDFLPQINTLYSISYWGLFKWLGLAPTNGIVIGILSTVALAVLAMVLYQRRIVAANKAFLMQAILLIALVPSLTVTDTEHFLFSLPLIAILITVLLTTGTSIWLKAMIIVGLVCFGGNWEDALGDLSQLMAHNGILGIGNVILIATGAYIILRYPRYIKQ